MNSKQFETAKMCLKVVTPINIADGIVLGAKDYLYDSRRQNVYFLNMHQWHMFIYKHMLLEKYESYLANFRDKQSLLEWLQMQGYDIELVRSVADAVKIPVTAIGGAGGIADLKKVLDEGHAHAAAGGSLFVYYGRLKAVLITAPSETELKNAKIYK